MTLSKSPKRRKILWKKREAIPSAVMDFFVGQRITPLVSPWSTTTRRELKSEEMGRSVMRSQEICWKGREVSDLMGDNRGTVGCVLVLFCWHLAQPSMYRRTKEARPGHQNSAATSWRVFRRPGWPVTVHLLYHGIFLFSVLRRTHMLFGMYSYDWIHTLILLSSLNSSFIEL